VVPARTVGKSRAVEDIERAITDISTWTAGFTRNIEYLQEAIAAYAEKQASAEDDKIPLPELQAAVDRLSEIQAECENILTGLETRLSTLKSSATVAVSLASGASFHDYASFGEFLVKLARVWEGVPRNETEAIQFAAKYYIMAFEAGKEIAHGNQAIQAAYLIAELSRRTGDHDTARQYFNKTIKMGQEFINEIRGDRTRTALAKKLLELALAQGKRNLAEAK
jgi:tetratricopeptide (TPR) repeat protein